MSSRRLLALGKRSIQSCSRAVPPGAAILLAQHSRHTPSPSSCSIYQRRHYATPPPQMNTNELTTAQYHGYSDTAMETLLDSLEGLLDDVANPDYEVEYSSGVLTLKLGEHGTYVINKQPPNKQIWLSSPLSGPKRYDYASMENKWIYYREQRSLGELLNTELSKIFDKEVDLGVDNCELL